MPQTLVTAPTVYPVSIAEARDHLRLGDYYYDDHYVQGLIAMATEYTEDVCGNRWITQTWDYWLPSFPDGDSIVLPFGKVRSVTSLSYTDHNDDETTWGATNYIVDTDSSPGSINLAYGIEWPTDTLKPVNPIKIRFVTGYGTAGSNVPYRVRQAIKILVNHWYENREMVIVNNIGQAIGVVPISVDSLLEECRMRLF